MSIIPKPDGSPESFGKEKSIWEHYNEMAVVEDNIREAEWRDLADTILVFVSTSTLYDVSVMICLQDGLFAAFLSAFLVFTIPQLQANSTDVAMDVLIHISQQLSNSTTPAYDLPEFTVPPTIAAVNVLFFLSLALVLIDAFLAMLVKGWLQEFDRGWRKYTVADLRAQERERRLQRLEHWKLTELVALLPILIQTSLLCFCIGLLVLLFPIHRISAILASLGLVAGLIFYAFTIYVSIIDIYAPFSSPLSRGLSRGLTTLIDAPRKLKAWVTWHIYRALPAQRHRAEMGSSMNSLLGNKNDALRNDAIEVVTPRPQIDPQTYVNVLERLVEGTAEGVENIPVFLELLDQPVKDPTLRPSNITEWKRLFRTTLSLLGDPSTFPDSGARTIARSVLFCYGGDYQQLPARLIYLFDQMESSQPGDHEPGNHKPGNHKPLNSLFALYLGYYCGFNHDHRILTHTIATLEPSNTADEELLWMVNTVHSNTIWQKDPNSVQERSLEFFAAVLTYISSTEQSRRSQIPLTAAVIYAMHTIKSALEGHGFGSIQGHYILPGKVLTTVERYGFNPIQGRYTLPGNALTTVEPMYMTFYQVGALDLWSKDCFELASELLQPHTHWLGHSASLVWQFQLPLIAALYIDSTKHLGAAPSRFADLLKLTSIPDITMRTWGHEYAYDRTKLAGYWYMAHFQEPLYQLRSQSSPFKDVGCVIIQIIEHSSGMNLSALHLLGTSVECLCGTGSPSLTLLPKKDKKDLVQLELKSTLPSGPIEYTADIPSDPWILVHLDTLFAQSSILQSKDVELLEWADTPEQIYIAKDRLALYDSLQREEHKETKQPRPDPQLLKMFLSSNDYSVCTGAFKCWLSLVSEPGAFGDVGVPILETMEYGGIKHLIQVTCGQADDRTRSWELLAERLVPKWSMLPSSWCNDFAFAFLSTPDMCKLPAYQFLAEALKEEGQLQALLSFLRNILEPIKSGWMWDQLTSLDNWLAQLPEVPEKADVHAQVETILTKMRQLAAENFEELPLVDSVMVE